MSNQTLVNPLEANSGSKRKDSEYYFNTASDYVAQHPVICTLGGLAFTYVIAGIFKSKQPGVGGKSFFKGGFQRKMDDKEALRILNLRESTLTRPKLKESHRRIMLLNHPDKGGSPFLATKINEAKTLLDKRPNLKNK
ncbi:TIM23 complex subunit [Komagataella phaffii CBS 7435]|uniref:J-protein co-chaperone of the mitochondrial import motor n=2 Tax=Komagataella phaffii TaxID=460519 RepID=C4R1X1_KOMPG|nr:J-protein co-chaperone of the mitochondrial import motor [Komagataella phaffii GS115]AOA62938.1 GQ67_00913T0 [Komagataella phaffii]CAH2447965.1 TIM23 complex subunit [Komagataella phaffii CBS 7435]AOA68071.1 GQ68_00476T0 [Komagataella phaffii GS115]CAY69495.1 J-protein co-chaperone of the mitochondrial import motor [Komagataella phaffii GS115]CCA38125.1 TIM23 complex subunit [Komagataella phaffii CBS 7435]